MKRFSIISTLTHLSAWVQILSLGWNAYGFVPRCRQIQQSLSPRRRHQHDRSHLSLSDSDNGDEEPNMGPEKSRMTDYISQYLGKTNQPIKNNDEGTATETAELADSSSASTDDDGSGTFTHLVAIPMDACHELLIELESVQRAILYHCPILVDACIPAASIRLPLLYVQGLSGHSNTAASMGTTKALADLVDKLSVKHLILKVDEDNGELEPDIPIEDVNDEGICPFTLTFQSLEIDGPNNNVLNTVAKPNDARTKRLQAFVRELKSIVEERYGWKTSFPYDPHPTEQEKAGGFRPRIQFMELPQAMDENLTKLRNEATEIKEEDAPFLKADEGGNGISPILWCQWWDDTFARKCRLREVSIYPQNAPMMNLGGSGNEWSYTQFYMPHESISLPDGTLAMQKSERKFEKYQEERLMEAQKEYEEQQQKGEGDASAPKAADEISGPVNPDILMTKTRERLEDAYRNSIEEIPVAEQIEQSVVEEVSEDAASFETVEDDEGDEDLDLQPITASPDDYVDDWTKERIRKIVENRDSVIQRQQIKKDKVPVEDNPVFKAYKEGTLVPFPESQKGEQKKQKDLGPYPGRDHFVGFWRMDKSPASFPVSPDSQDSSDNLILRVDGTTAGGPILDQESKQKAAGGTWRFIEDGATGEARLRIRLIIPPSKQRIMVLEGAVQRFSANTDFPMTSRAFGVPELEEKIKQANRGAGEDILQCEGEVFIEDAVTKKNKENIGVFSISKIQGVGNRRDYTITVPKPMLDRD